MRKTKLLLPIIGISALTSVAIPLAGCSCKKGGGGGEDEKTPLCFTDVAGDGESAKISYTIVDGSLPDIQIQVSKDAKIWSPWDGTEITLNDGGKIYVKNNANSLSKQGKTFKFSMTAPVSASGNVNSMINYSGLSDHCFQNMFRDCAFLTQAPELPATTLKQYCYTSMFQGCTSLVAAPALPAKNLDSSCYDSLFLGCTKITQAPELPATTLAPNCYQAMFNNCSLLNKAPQLPAKKLVYHCYTSMFRGCTALSTPPEFKDITFERSDETTKAEGCCLQMFQSCTALVKAPKLTKEEPLNETYKSMFEGCTNLKIQCDPLSPSNNDEDTWIFDYPAETTWIGIDDMFKNTGGTFEGTPVSGYRYSWYTE